jgi:hypothetical protein
MTLSMPGLALINLTIQGGVVISEPTHMEDVIIMGTASGTCCFFVLPSHAHSSVRA